MLNTIRNAVRSLSPAGRAAAASPNSATDDMRRYALLRLALVSTLVCAHVVHAEAGPRAGTPCSGSLSCQRSCARMSFTPRLALEQQTVFTALAAASAAAPVQLSGCQPLPPAHPPPWPCYAAPLGISGHRHLATLVASDRVTVPKGARCAVVAATGGKDFSPSLSSFIAEEHQQPAQPAAAAYASTVRVSGRPFLLLPVASVGRAARMAAVANAQELEGHQRSGR